MSVSIAADKLLRYYIDARYKNENIYIAKIKAIVSSATTNTCADTEVNVSVDTSSVSQRQKYVYNRIQELQGQISCYEDELPALSQRYHQ